MYRMKRGMCSFCRKKRPTIKRMAQDHQICDECIYLSNVHGDRHHMGAIVCNGCKNWEAFTFYSLEGGMMKFAPAGIDEEQVMIYNPVFTSNAIPSEPRDLKMIVCDKCRKEVPGWILNHNKYLSTYFQESSNVQQSGRPKNKAS